MTNRNQETQRASDSIEHIHNYVQATSDRVSEIGERIESGMREASQATRARVRELDIDETTIPDAFRSVPKAISPKVHAWLDFAVTTYFLGLGVWFAMRGKGGAAAAAFINGGMVAGVSMFTDYDGDRKKPITFKMHGTLDAVQATTAALGPVLHGFAGEPEAKYFYGQAANELAVISTTDWDAGMPSKRRRRAV
jgi:hypothetical protein